ALRGLAHVIRFVFDREVDLGLSDGDQQFPQAGPPLRDRFGAKQRQAGVQLVGLSKVDREQLQGGKSVRSRFAEVVNRVLAGDVAAENSHLFDRLLKLGKLSLRGLYCGTLSQRAVDRIEP